MKIVGNLHASSAFRASPDDIAPLKGIVWNDVIAKIAATYKFAAIPASQTPQAQFYFQNGAFESAQQKIPIQALFLTNSGAAVQALTTDQSDEVLENLIDLLDDSFEFRIRASSLKRDYASHAVIHFEKSIESCIAVLGTINELVRNAVSVPVQEPFSIKRFAFGKENKGQTVNSMFGLDAVDNMDFTIERRANHPFAENRYYVAAPISTEKLFRTLEEIERVIKKLDLNATT